MSRVRWLWAVGTAGLVFVSAAVPASGQEGELCTDVTSYLPSDSTRRAIYLRPDVQHTPPLRRLLHVENEGHFSSGDPMPTLSEAQDGCFVVWLSASAPKIYVKPDTNGYRPRVRVVSTPPHRCGPSNPCGFAVTRTTRPLAATLRVIRGDNPSVFARASIDPESLTSDTHRTLRFVYNRSVVLGDDYEELEIRRPAACTYAMRELGIDAAHSGIVCNQERLAGAARSSSGGTRVPVPIEIRRYLPPPAEVIEQIAGGRFVLEQVTVGVFLVRRPQASVPDIVLDCRGAAGHCRVHSVFGPTEEGEILYNPMPYGLTPALPPELEIVECSDCRVHARSSVDVAEAVRQLHNARMLSSPLYRESRMSSP